jgi:hypothetical protein
VSSFNKSFEDRREGAGLGRIKSWPNLSGICLSEGSLSIFFCTFGEDKTPINTVVLGNCQLRTMSEENASKICGN